MKVHFGPYIGTREQEGRAGLAPRVRSATAGKAGTSKSPKQAKTAHFFIFTSTDTYSLHISYHSKMRAARVVRLPFSGEATPGCSPFSSLTSFA